MVNMEKVNILTNDIKEIFNQRLTSIILYGSAASDSYNPKTSDINLIVVLDTLQAVDLKNAFPVIKKWLKTKNPAPLFMDKQEWCNSIDVYSIEYSDIIEKHKIIYGEDLTQNLKIEKYNLRLQCESEIKKLLILLRQAYLINSKDIKVVNHAIKKSTGSFLAIFRSILRILDIEIPKDNKNLINLITEKSQCPCDVFLKIIKTKEERKDFKKHEVEELMQNLIDGLNTILKYVDSMKIIRGTYLQ